jgi:cell division protein FtsI/penicillin-binding protein 2
VGQGTLTVTPLHMALLTAAIARQGEMPAPHIIQAIQNLQGEWETVPTLDHPIAVLASEAAEAVRALMPNGHSATALSGSGENRTTLAWFSGFAPFENPRYAVVVLLEAEALEQAEKIGQALLQEAGGTSARLSSLRTP